MMLTGFMILLALVVAVAVGTGLVYIQKAAQKAEPKKPAVDMDTPVEELHKIVKRRFVTNEYNSMQVLAQVVCVCGWTTESVRQDYARDEGDVHVRNRRAEILRNREVARKVAETLAENKKGDFAW